MDLLEPREEEELFKSRLLNVEEKPFKRITKRLATLHRVVVTASARQEPTPPPEAVGGGGDLEEKEEDETATEEERRQAAVRVLSQLREDVTLDFAAFDASIARLRFLGAANAGERAHYATDRGTIADTCDGVRADMVRLRAQLADARATLAVRQGFDELADRITQSRTLLPRPDQQATICKLEEECRQLQAESEAYTATWRERKEQFARIMDESMRLRRLIRDEKEEVERREGMDEDEEGAASATAATATSRPVAPPGTPGGAHAPETPLAGGDDGSTTPRPGSESRRAGSDGASPLLQRDSPVPPDADGGGGGENNNNNNSNKYQSKRFLLPLPEPESAARSFSRAGSGRADSSRGGSRATSREGTPAVIVDPVTAATQQQETADVDMTEAVGTPPIVTLGSPLGDNAEEDKMITT